MKVYTIEEENYGQIGIAVSRKAALQWLITSAWVCQYSNIWCPNKNERRGGHNMTLDDLYGENWKEKFLQFSDELLENMGFFIHEEELIEEKDQMNIWIVLGWEESYGNWEVLGVLFDEAAVEVKVKEILTEYMYYNHVKVECWHKDDADSPDASFYEVETYWRDDYVKGE